MKSISHIISANRFNLKGSLTNGNALLRNCLIVVITTIGMLPELSTSGNYLLSQDITHQILPFVIETKKMLSSGTPFWSWNTYLGDNFYAAYSYYTLFNPFTWLNCLFPYSHIMLGFTLILYLKFLICGYLANKLFKCLGFDDRLSLIGSLLFCFSSWAICNLLYYIFFEPMILLLLTLISLERFLNGEKYRCSMLIVVSFLVVIVNFYFSPIIFMLGAIYAFCRLFASSSFKGRRIALTSQAFACVFAGVLMASFVLVPVLMYLSGSQRQSFFIETYRSFLPKILDRIFWLFNIKTYEGTSYYMILDSTWGSNAASIAVFGVLPAILLFMRKGLKWVKWFTAILIVIYATPLNAIFSLFTDYYYSRWAYGLSLALILATLYYLKNFGVPRLKYAIIYCIVVYGASLLLLLASVWWLKRDRYLYPDIYIFNIGTDIAMLILNTAALIAVCCRRELDRRWYATAVATVSVCCSAQFFMASYKELPAASSDESFILTETEYFVSNQDFRQPQDLGYRTHFTVMNDGAKLEYPSNFGVITNRPSVQTYHSMQNPGLRRWNDIINGKYENIRNFMPVNHIESFEAITSVKDLVIISLQPVDTLTSLKRLGHEGLFSVFESDHYIPMGMAYDSYMLSSELDSIINNSKDDEVDVPRVLLGTVAIADDAEAEISRFLTKASPQGDAPLDSLVTVRSSAVCDVFSPSSRGFRAHINLSDERLVMFSVLADKGFKATIDGVPAKIYDVSLGFSAVAVPAGSHEIVFEYTPPGLYAGIWISVLGLLVLIWVFTMEYRSSRLRQEHRQNTGTSIEAP